MTWGDRHAKRHTVATGHKTAFQAGWWECRRCHSSETKGDTKLENKTTCRECERKFDFTGFVYCPKCAAAISRSERAYFARITDDQYNGEEA